MSEFLSRNRIGVGIAAVVAIVIIAGGGYYLGWRSPSASGTVQTASIAESGVCKHVVARARDYGVLPPDAQKTGSKSVSDTDPDRVTCNAQANNATYTLIATVPCDDAKDAKCLKLQKVTNAQGEPLYDTHDI